MVNNITAAKRASDKLNQEYQRRGTWKAVAEYYGLSKGVIWRAAKNKGCSNAVARAVLGEGWVTITIRCATSGVGGSPGNIMLPEFELRQCPVTDVYFVVQSIGHQKYRADLSPAVRRAARRDLVKCRVKFGLVGDWGKHAKK